MPLFLKQYSVSYVHTINIPHTIYIVLSSVGNLEWFEICISVQSIGMGYMQVNYFI